MLVSRGPQRVATIPQRPLDFRTRLAPASRGGGRPDVMLKSQRALVARPALERRALPSIRCWEDRQGSMNLHEAHHGNLKLIKLKFVDNRSVYSSLTMMHLMLNAIGFGVDFKAAIHSLQGTFGAGYLQELGFPNHWPIGATGW